SPEHARATLADQSEWLSRAGHGLDALADVELRALTAVVVSPVWEERKGRAALGAAGLQERVHTLKARAPELLVYALGGVSAENANESLSCGADGVAAMGVVTDARERTRLLSALEILL